MNNDTYQRIYTRDEYLAELRHYLRKLPPDDYKSAMEYFTEYLDEAGPENEAQAIRDLGTPKEAASEILQNLLNENTTQKSDTARTIKIAAIAMLLSPLGWFGLFFGGILLVASGALIVALVAAAFAVLAALFYSGGALIVSSFDMIGQSLAAAVVISGGGILAIGLGLLIVTICLALCRAISHGAASLFHRLSQKGRA